jgi:hypothetical protein
MPAPISHRSRHVAKLRRPPDRWHPLWLERMDLRFKNLAIVRQQLAALEDDLGAGEPDRLSWVQRRLANHLVWADTMAEDLERRFAAGEVIDTSQFAALASVIARLSGMLGIERRAKNVTTFSDFLPPSAKRVAVR